MKCPHCDTAIHRNFEKTSLHGGKTFCLNKYDSPRGLIALTMACPECKRAIVELLELKENGGASVPAGCSSPLVFPTGRRTFNAPAEVPADLAEDFNEAAVVLPYSPKASAALSRRCLQGVLRSKGYTHKDLAPAIQALLDSGRLPSELADNVDAIRNIGNFAAHPMKDTNTQAVLPVEEHEAEWNLEVLQGLFDFFYVQPVKAQARRDAMNLKLQAAGKPPLKSP